MTPFGMSGSVQVSVIVVSVGSAVNPVDGEEAVCFGGAQFFTIFASNDYMHGKLFYIRIPLLQYFLNGH